MSFKAHNSHGGRGGGEAWVVKEHTRMCRLQQQNVTGSSFKFKIKVFKISCLWYRARV